MKPVVHALLAFTIGIRGELAPLALIRKISSANARWGSPRIVGELKKLGIKVA
jgi:hypothetical protein